MEYLLDDYQRPGSPPTSTEIRRACDIDHTTQMKRTRDRLKEAGLIRTRDGDTGDGPLRPPKEYRPTEFARDHADTICRGRDEMSVEERLEELEAEVEELRAAVNRMRYDDAPPVDPDEFQFGD